MKNKIELKKTVIASLLTIIMISIGFGIFQIYQYSQYTKNFNNAIDKLVTQIVEKYPTITKTKLMEILNSNSQSTNILREYGIDLEEDTIVLENEELFTKYVVVNISIILMLAFLLMIYFLKYNHTKNKKLLEITQYIEEINHQNYKLDIEDNTEDELSILKNELYKTTIMLKEVAQNSLNDKIQLKDSISDISHQLKTPLTSITILLDNILDNPQMEKDTKQEFIKDVKREITNISFLVDALLKLSKFDSNTIVFHNKLEIVEEILKEARKNVLELCDLKNVEIVLQGDNTIQMACDFKWQVEAITNILKNCVEHSNQDSKITIAYGQNKMYTQIEIKDQGKGIDKEDLPHIFERFYKGKNSSSDSIGIGLALAKSIIQNNNGCIVAKSELDKGSTFMIKQPRKI